ncbi:MAG: glycosyltransferase family 2 protein [Candidatus Woesearchaeota archaeon]|jgi:GT2 family glycosyltransferase
MKKTIKHKISSQDVTIIIPTHSASVTDVVSAVQIQEYVGQVTIFVIDDGPRDRSAEMLSGITYIKNEKNIGLANTLNKGIRLAKTPYIITLHQDCIPISSQWLTELMIPFKDISVVLSSSEQILPVDVWNKFSFWHRVFTVPELKLQTTISEHATAYKRDVVLTCGLFDSQTHRTAGEDTDLFIKMRHYGLLVESHARVKHVHAPHNDSLWNFIKKVYLRDNEAMGVLHRKYFFKMGFQFYYDFLRTILFIFLITFLFFNHYMSLLILGIIVIFANYRLFKVLKHIQDIHLIFLPFIYIAIWFMGFFAMWKGFISAQQNWFNN